MSQIVNFHGKSVTVVNFIPQTGSKAKTFTLVAKDLSDIWGSNELYEGAAWKTENIPH